MSPTRLPRKAFDAVETPVAKVAESLLETDSFMDALAVAWKVNRSALRRIERGAPAGMRVIGVPTRADVVELVNQIGGLSKSYILDLQPENSMVRYAEEIARPAIADWTRRHSANRRTSTAKENGDRHTARATAA